MSTSGRNDVDNFASEWMTQVKAGLTYRKKYSTRQSWDAYRKYYRGNWAAGLVPINKIFSYGRSMMPKVYYRAPRVTVTPTHPELIFHARVVEALDNLLIKDLYLKHTLKMAALDSYLCGVGPIKLGYDSEFGYLPSQGVNEDGETITQYSKEQAGVKIEYSQLVKPGMPWAIRTRPEDTIVPWGSVDSFSLKWLAHYILRPLDDIKNDQKYKNTDKLEGTRSPRMAEDRPARAAFRPRHEREKGIKYAELFEIRDFKTGNIIVVCEDQLLLADKDELQTSAGIPWEFINFNPDPEFFWGIPDAHIIVPQQLELNLANTQVSRHRAIALVKFLYLKGAITKESLDAFLSGDPGVAVEIDSNNVQNVAAAIQTLQPHIPPDLYKDMMATIQAMREELGFSQNQEGAFSPYHGKTATETMEVSQNSNERTDERRDMMGDCLVNIIRKWNQMIFKFWTEQKVIKIITPQGTPAWIEYTGDQLKADYTLSIDADSGMPVTRSLKYQMANDLFAKFNGDQLIDQVLLRQIMLDNYDIVDPRTRMLLQAQYAGKGEEIAAARQPMPLMPGMGKGAAGGRQGSSSDQPIPFDRAKQLALKGSM